VTKDAKGQPVRLPLAALVAAVVLGVALTSSVGVAAPTSAAGGPPNALFAKGYNLCRVAPLSAIRKAGGQAYRPGLFVNRVCNWERGDLLAGITLSTHPSQVGAALMRNFLAQNGEGGLEARTVKVPGASKAVLVTLPRTPPGQVSKNLFAAFKPGAIQINMTAPRSLPDSRLIAVMRLVART
jgi:hypothetical protein